MDLREWLKVRSNYSSLFHLLQKTSVFHEGINHNNNSKIIIVNHSGRNCHHITNFKGVCNIYIIGFCYLLRFLKNSSRGGYPAEPQGSITIVTRFHFSYTVPHFDIITLNSTSLFNRNLERIGTFFKEKKISEKAMLILF